MISIEIRQEDRVLKWLFTIAIALVCANVLNIILGYPSWQITRLIDIGGETNFTAWFSSGLLAVAAIYAYRCSRLRSISIREHRMWQISAAVFLAMSCDDVAMIHEHVGMAIKKHCAFAENFGTPFMLTVAPFIVIAALIFAFKMRHYIRNSKNTLRLLAIGMFVYIGGAWVVDLANNFIGKGSPRFIGGIENVLEESLELFGTIIIIKGLGEYYRCNYEAR